MKKLNIKIKQDFGSEIFFKERVLDDSDLHINLVKICDEMKSNWWEVTSHDFSSSKKNFSRIHEKHQDTILRALIISTVLEDYIKDKISAMIETFQTNEVQDYLIACKHQENIHSKSYKRLFVLYSGYRSDTFKYPDWVVSLKRKIDAYFEKCNSVTKLIASMAAIEGMLFHEIFVVPQSLKIENVLPDLVAINDEVSRDENNHFRFWVECYSMLSDGKESLCKEAVDFFYNVGLEISNMLCSDSEDIFGFTKRNKTSSGSSKVKIDVFETLTFDKMKGHLGFLKKKVETALGLKSTGSEQSKSLSIMGNTNGLKKKNFLETKTTEYQKNLAVTNSILKILPTGF